MPSEEKLLKIRDLRMKIEESENLASIRDMRNQIKELKEGSADA